MRNATVPPSNEPNTRLNLHKHGGTTMRYPKPLKGSGKYPIWRWGLTPEDHVLHLEMMRTLAHLERGRKQALAEANR